MTVKNKRVTSQDVANLAGVSRTTVSLVLNKVEGAHISPETQQKVREAAGRDLRIESLPQLRILRRDADRAAVRVADAILLAAAGQQRRGAERNRIRPQRQGLGEVRRDA